MSEDDSTVRQLDATEVNRMAQELNIRAGADVPPFEEILPGDSPQENVQGSASVAPEQSDQISGGQVFPPDDAGTSVAGETPEQRHALDREQES